MEFEQGQSRAAYHFCAERLVAPLLRVRAIACVEAAADARRELNKRADGTGHLASTYANAAMGMSPKNNK